MRKFVVGLIAGVFIGASLSYYGLSHKSGNLERVEVKYQSETKKLEKEVKKLNKKVDEAIGEVEKKITEIKENLDNTDYYEKYNEGNMFTGLNINKNFKPADNNNNYGENAYNQENPFSLEDYENGRQLYLSFLEILMIDDEKKNKMLSEYELSLSEAMSQ